MTQHTSLDPVTEVISEVVQRDKIEAYENWVKGINQAVKEFTGFLGVDVIRPRDPANLEYVVIVRFDTCANLKSWKSSATCRQWMEKSQGMQSRGTHLQEANGLELWFTLPTKAQQSSPAYYKLVVVGILAVYPLVILSNLLIGPLVSELPYLVAVFISVVAISMLITYPVMPWLTRLLSFWLYPKRDQ